MRKFWVGTGMAIALAAAAVAQDTTTDGGLLDGLLSGGLIAFVVIVALGYFAWTWLLG